MIQITDKFIYAPQGFYFESTLFEYLLGGTRFVDTSYVNLRNCLA